jgi:hypothetical protein
MNRRSAFLVLALLACCGAARADQSPPPSIAPFIPRTRSVRPVVAAGLHYIYSLDASFYEVYRRNDDGTPGAVVVRRTALWSIFAPLLAQLNANTNYPAATGIKKCPANLAGQAYYAPAQGLMPFENAACMEEAVDSDVYYDPQTKRIWILAKFRPSIWQCPNGRRGFYTPADPKDVCHLVSADVLKQILHRYIGIAVSRPGASADVEDPANGFNTYILADDYGDWSQLMVHNGLVLVNYRDLQTNNRLYVFRASDLMTNRFTPDGDLLPKSLATFDNGNFNGPAVDWVHNSTVDVRLSVAMMFVRQQSDDAVTYLLSGTSDGRMVVYGLLSKSGPDGPTPGLIMPAVVKLPTPMESLQKASGAYIDGYLYWGWEETDPRNRNRWFIRTFRWEVHQSAQPWGNKALGNTYPIYITTAPNSGYLEADIGKADQSLSYVLPTLNAAPDGNVITMFHTYPANEWPKGPFQASVQYAVLRKGQTAYDSPYLLEAGEGYAEYPPHRGGVLDIVGVAADPLVAGQYFLGNAFTDAKGGWPHVIAAVKP